MSLPSTQSLENTSSLFLSVTCSVALITKQSEDFNASEKNLSVIITGSGVAYCRLLCLCHDIHIASKRDKIGRVGGQGKEGQGEHRSEKRQPGDTSGNVP